MTHEINAHEHFKPVNLLNLEPETDAAHALAKAERAALLLSLTVDGVIQQAEHTPPGPEAFELLSDLAGGVWVLTSHARERHTKAGSSSTAAGEEEGQ